MNYRYILFMRLAYDCFRIKSFMCFKSLYVNNK